MAENEIEIRATPENVFRIFVDPRAYGSWVVGPDAVVDVSDDWPRVGSCFTHETTLGPLRVRDVTEIERIEVPRIMTLRANIRPIGLVARIVLELSESEAGTCVRLVEYPIAGAWRSTWNPVLDRLLWARNTAALQRLRVIVESSAGDGAQALEAAGEEPGAPTVVSIATTLAFWGLSKARTKRIFHPVGEVYEARLTGTRPPLDGVMSDRALLRFSKGAGTPGRLPDVYGLAVKLVDAWGPDADQDLLMVTSGEGPLTRHTLVPTTRPLSMRFSSVLPYRVQGRLATFGARIASSASELCGATMSLDLAAGSGAWQPVATIAVGDPFTGDVAFDPWNSSARMVPAGPLNAWRRAAYQGSREGRSA